MLKIRKATADDLPQIYQFEQKYIEEIEPANLKRWQAAEHRIKQDLEASLANMFIAEDQGTAVGHCYWNVYEDHAHIFSIFVLKPYRKSGVASQLMQHTEAHCQKAGYTNCRLQTLKTNPAQHFFQRAGYEFVELEGDWQQYVKYF